MDKKSVIVYDTYDCVVAVGYIDHEEVFVVNMGNEAVEVGDMVHALVLVDKIVKIGVLNCNMKND